MHINPRLSSHSISPHYNLSRISSKSFILSVCIIMSATTATRRQLLSVYKSAVNSVKPNSLIRDSIQIDTSGLLSITERCSKKQFTARLTGRDIYIFGAGKAVLGMAEELLSQIELHNKLHLSSIISINRGLLNVPLGTIISRPSLLASYNITTYPSAKNNIPDLESAQNTLNLLQMLEQAKSNSSSSSIPLILGFISGGGSALLSLPKPPVTIIDKQNIIQDLVRHGADIVELNTVRSALSSVKHGKLAQKIISEPNPCQLVAFIISDIINDPIDKIASGPTVLVKEQNTLKPMEIIEKYGIIVNENVRKLLILSSVEAEEPEKPELIQNILIGNNSIALSAAKKQLTELNFKVVNCGSNKSGEAKEVVKELLGEFLKNYKNVESFKEDYRGICWLAGGETTVNMKLTEKIGLGGRCQEMGLVFLSEMLHFQAKLPGTLYALFAGTDGQDGPTPAAGVLINWPLLDKQIGINEDILAKAMVAHDSYSFFKNYFPQFLIETGVSGTNVMDMYCLVYEF